MFADKSCSHLINEGILEEVSQEVSPAHNGQAKDLQSEYQNDKTPQKRRWRSYPIDSDEEEDNILSNLTPFEIAKEDDFDQEFSSLEIQKVNDFQDKLNNLQKVSISRSFSDTFKKQNSQLSLTSSTRQLISTPEKLLLNYLILTVKSKDSSYSKFQEALSKFSGLAQGNDWMKANVAMIEVYMLLKDNRIEEGAIATLRLQKIFEKLNCKVGLGISLLSRSLISSNLAKMPSQLHIQQAVEDPADLALLGLKTFTDTNHQEGIDLCKKLIKQILTKSNQKTGITLQPQNLTYTQNDYELGFDDLAGLLLSPFEEIQDE